MPAAPAVDACRRFLTSDVAEFIRLISFGERKRGTPQGSPWSPLLFNIFADRFVDRPWHRRHAERPLFRYVDDLLVMAASVEEAVDLYRSVDRLTRSAGVPLKGPAAASITDLDTGRSVQWLGFWIYKTGDRVSVRVAPRAWDRLDRELDKCHFVDAAPLRAAEVVVGWLGYLGPCYADENRGEVIARVRESAARHAFNELPSDDVLHDAWAAAHAGWLDTRAKAEHGNAHDVAASAWSHNKPKDHTGGGD